MSPHVEIHRLVITGEAIDRITANPEDAKIFEAPVNHQCRIVEMRSNPRGLEILVEVCEGNGERHVTLVAKPKATETDLPDPLKFD